MRHWSLPTRSSLVQSGETRGLAADGMSGRPLHRLFQASSLGGLGRGGSRETGYLIEQVRDLGENRAFHFTETASLLWKRCHRPMRQRNLISWQVSPLSDLGGAVFRHLRRPVSPVPHLESCRLPKATTRLRLASTKKHRWQSGVRAEKIQANRLTSSGPKEQKNPRRKDSGWFVGHSPSRRRSGRPGACETWMMDDG